MVARYRSRFEADFSRDLRERGIKATYEPTKITYVPKPRKYTPDFYLTEYGFYIETKGYFTSLDRTKHKLIKDQHPDIDIRFIFQNARNLLRNHSKTTYGDWCDNYGFMYAEKRMPTEWMKKTITT